MRQEAFVNLIAIKKCDKYNHLIWLDLKSVYFQNDPLIFIIRLFSLNELLILFNTSRFTDKNLYFLVRLISFHLIKFFLVSCSNFLA